MNGTTYTNSLEALESNLLYFDFFEIDFVWTSDGALVCLHDWAFSANRTFGAPMDPPPTLEEFEHLVAQHERFTNCTASTLIDWLVRHPGVKLVTDVKDDNVKALAYLAERHPLHRTQIIPQIYHPDEYAPARELGYESIIWTIYRYGGDDDDIVAKARAMNLFAVTMPRRRAKAGLAQRLAEHGIASYAHTVNELEELEMYLGLGVEEVYTDWLRPDPSSGQGR